MPGQEVDSVLERNSDALHSPVSSLFPFGGIFRAVQYEQRNTDFCVGNIHIDQAEILQQEPGLAINRTPSSRKTMGVPPLSPFGELLSGCPWICVLEKGEETLCELQKLQQISEQLIFYYV